MEERKPARLEYMLDVQYRDLEVIQLPGRTTRSRPLNQYTEWIYCIYEIPSF